MDKFAHRLLGIRELAEILGISRQTIYNKVHKNADPKFPIRFIRCGRLIKFDPTDVHNYIESNKVD